MEEIQKKQISVELRNLFESDQEDRMAGGLGETDRVVLMQKSAERLARVKELIKTEELLSPEDLYQVAMLFQHGATAEDYRQAHEYAKKSAELGYKNARWLVAASEDRHLVSLGQKQKWGTQYRRREDGLIEQLPLLSDIDSGITDAVRSEFGVNTRSQQEQELKLLNNSVTE